MQNNPFLQNFDNKPIVIAGALAQLGSGTNDQVHGKFHVEIKPNLRGGQVAGSAVCHHDHQIHVGILRRDAIGVRAKQDDPFRIKSAHDASNRLRDGSRIDEAPFD